MSPFNKSKFHDFISTFFSLASDKTIDMMENFWSGIQIAGDSIANKAKRLVASINPSRSKTDVFDEYYEINISILKSKPMPLDPTDAQSNYIIKPISIIYSEPIITGVISKYSDMIEISPDDYYKMRDICIGAYLVISIYGDSSADRYFRISNMLSSEESLDSNRYYNPDSSNDLKYIISLEGANLDYINDREFNIYMTTGRVFDIDRNITELDTLKTTISDVIEDDGLSLSLINGDYVLSYGFIEFRDDITQHKSLGINNKLYCKKAVVMEHNIFNMYGTLVGIPDWNRYVNDNTSGKALISGLLKSLQNSSSASDYNRALNIYYGMPTAPQDCTVQGLYESYEYEVTSVSNLTIRIKTSESSLHKFFQPGGSVLLVSNNQEIEVSSINYDTKELTLKYASDIKIGSKICIKLPNRFKLKNTDANAMLLESSENIYAAGMISHIIDIQGKIASDLYEVIVYGSSDHNNIYHMVSSEISNNTLKISVYNHSADSTPRYNDFISKTESDIPLGLIHMAWPTHKFLLLRLKDGSMYKAYIDAPIDTIYDTGDNIKMYDVICRNVFATNNKEFDGWNEFNKFRRYSGIDVGSNILELTAPTRGVRFGEYYPYKYLSELE